MARRIRILAVLGLLACCGAPAARASSRTACGPAGAHTLASSRVARVYSVHGTVYGCSKVTGKQRRLGSATTCINSTRIQSAAVAGELAAYGAERCGIDTASTEVVVRRLSDGRTLHTDPATTLTVGPESHQNVRSLVLKPDGADAWIAKASSLGTKRTSTEVHKHDPSGPSLLDSGPAIQPGSLRLHGSKLTWRDGAASRSATLR